MIGTSMPPTKPTVPVVDFSAAMAPTRNEPVCSSKMIDCTFGASTTASITTNLVSGNSAATVVERGAPREAGHHDGVRPLRSEAAEGLLALRVVLQFEVGEGAAGLGLPGLGAVIGRLVEGFVELAAEVIDHGRVGEGSTGEQHGTGDAGSKSTEVLRKEGHEGLPVSHPATAIAALN